MFSLREFGFQRATTFGVRGGKPRIPSGIEGWAGFLPRPLSAFPSAPPKMILAEVRLPLTFSCEIHVSKNL